MENHYLSFVGNVRGVQPLQIFCSPFLGVKAKFLASPTITFLSRLSSTGTTFTECTSTELPKIGERVQRKMTSSVHLFCYVRIISFPNLIGASRVGLGGTDVREKRHFMKMSDVRIIFFATNRGKFQFEKYIPC